jgi:hypothetical protein
VKDETRYERSEGRVKGCFGTSFAGLLRTRQSIALFEICADVSRFSQELLRSIGMDNLQVTVQAPVVAQTGYGGDRRRNVPGAGGRPRRD